MLGEQNSGFVERSLGIFRDQYARNAVYHEYVDLIGVDPDMVDSLEAIPFLPIQYFKTHRVVTGEGEPQAIFESSGTSGQARSRHEVFDLNRYVESFTSAFNHFYGSPGDYRFFALLPSYLERTGSSLVFMMDYLIKQSRYTDSQFYLDDIPGLARKLVANTSESVPTILLGISYALLDLAELIRHPIREVIVMETGGMKGTRTELPKAVLHKQLCEAFGVEEIHAEYGMTELMSQAYSKGQGNFFSPNWMSILIRDVYDPFSYLPDGRSGGINIVDLANVDSCAFIQTEDLGKINSDGSFQVLGRLNNSDVRGCNLLVD